MRKECVKVQRVCERARESESVQQWPRRETMQRHQNLAVLLLQIIHTELYRAILTGYNTNKRKCVDIISNHSGIRSELIKVLHEYGLF